MTLFEKLEAANREYLDAMKLTIEITQKETALKIEKERVRRLYSTARDEMWALEQEAKEIKVHDKPLTALELQAA